MSERKSEVDIVLEGLDSGPPVDSERWERPTKARIRKIEQHGPKETYPPPSTETLVRSIQAWLKANAWILALLGVGSTTGMVTPWRDWLGLATKAEVIAEAKRNDAARRAQDEAVARELQKVRRVASEAANRVEELESQLVAQKVLLESYRPKRRR